MKSLYFWLFFIFVACTSKNTTTMNTHCDTETGVCTPSELVTTPSAIDTTQNIEIIYVGDPMCSWCYGIAPELKKLKSHYDTKNIPFKIIVNGLRPGGGDA